MYEGKRRSLATNQHELEREVLLKEKKASSPNLGLSVENSPIVKEAILSK
jgi:hypothetical protein